MTRRGFHGIGATATAVLSGAALAACAGRDSSSAGGATPAKAERNYAVSFMTTFNLEATGIQEILDEYRTQYPKVQLEALRGNEEKLRSMMAAGTPPDVARINDNYVQDFAREKLTQPMDPFMKTSRFRRKDFFELIYDFGVFDGELKGKRYAWAMGAASRVLYLNLNLFREAGINPPPNDKWDVRGWTMDDLLETAQRLTKAPDQWGVEIFSHTAYEQTFSVNFGHPDGVFSKDGKRFTLADPISVEAVQWVTDLATRYRVQPDWATVKQQNARKMFEAGKVAMHYDVFGVLGRFRKGLQFAWDVAPLPKRVKRLSVNSLYTYGLPTLAKEPEGGWHLLEFFAGDYAAKVFARTGHVIPTHRKHAQEITKAAKDQPPKAMHLFVQSMDYHTLPTLVRNTEEVRRTYRPKLYGPVHQGDVTARAMLTSVRPAVEALLNM